MRPRIAVILASTEIGLRLNKTTDEANVMSEAANDKLYLANGEYPTAEEILAECGVVIDQREDKPWPEAEDCDGCDKHKDGPHRFGCKRFSHRVRL